MQGGEWKESEDGEGRLTIELHDGVKTFANLFPPFRTTNSLIESISWPGVMDL